MNNAPHIPVMLNEVLTALSPQNGGHYIDGTFGAGGYTRAILNKADCRVGAIDRDITAINNAKETIEQYAPRLSLIHDCFGNIAEHFEPQSIDGIVLDIGVSSMQIDQAERGFSFLRDGPLDMRMGEGETAADLIARIDEVDLANLIYKYGEERQSRRIAKAITNARQEETITTTLQLANIIEAACPRKRGDKIHPATRAFQALRIAVNDELGELERALDASISVLKPGGRLIVVTFHSLEDRIVKNFLKDHSDKVTATNKYAKEQPKITKPYDLITRKAILASKEEASQNPRARSAKLRAAIRTEVSL